VLIFFALAASTRAQNCPGYNPQVYQSGGGTSAFNPPNPCSGQSLNATVSFSQTNSTTDYCSQLSYPSIVTGWGYAHCTPYPVYCTPFFELQVTVATAPGDYNRFYNRAYYSTYTSSGCVTNSNVGFNQDFWQCGWVVCPPPPGDGGGGDPSAELGSSGPSPIIIDISGKGFVLTNATAGVTFDISGTGHPIQMGWTAPRADNAFLALPGADGLIHNGTQLFGNFTPQPRATTPNGFAALAVYDDPKNGGNGDGVIDARDAVFASLRLWIDANHDGISQPEELHTLPSLGVNSISLTYKEDRRTDQFGNVFRYRVQVNPGDATNTGRMAYDVFFVTTTSTAKNRLNPEGSRCSVPAIKAGLLATAGGSR